MNPEAGPPTPAEGRARLQAAHAQYEAACRELAARGAPIRTPMFGAVPVADFVRFMEQHMRHHWRQLPRGTSRRVAVRRRYMPGIGRNSNVSIVPPGARKCGWPSSSACSALSSAACRTE